MLYRHLIWINDRQVWKLRQH